MEWGRAKTILILSFFCLNLLLGYQLWTSKVDLEQSSTGTPEADESVNQMLKKKLIQLDLQVPVETPKLKEITVKFDPDMVNSEITQMLDPPVKSSEAFTKSRLKDGLSKSVPMSEQYEYDQVVSTDDNVVLHQLYGPYPLFDVQLVLNQTNNEFISFRQQYVQVMPSSSAKEQKVLPAMTAIGRLAENLLPPGTVIKEVRLGYHGQIYNSETQVLAPTWRVTTANGDMYYVHAINGAVETTQQEK